MTTTTLTVNDLFPPTFDANLFVRALTTLNWSRMESLVAAMSKEQRDEARLAVLLGREQIMESSYCSAEVIDNALELLSAETRLA